ncbi:MAG: ACP S-malonyltransferase [Pseudomonadota bacterium]
MRFAMVFPGQGSQSIGMLAGLAENYPVVTDTFDEASEVLGFDLWQLCQDGPEEKLNTTQCTQPAMLAAGVAVWRVWCERGGPSPSVTAGHSLGEYSALVSAESIAFPDAVRVVADRARFMQEAVPIGIGAVAAILGLDDDAVREACTQSEQGEVVRAVNFNAPGQVVIAGHKGAVERTIESAGAAGAKKAMMLPLSVPVHSPLMAPAAERFRETLERATFSVPSIDVLSNVEVSPYRDVDAIRRNLAAQLFSPVPWTETIVAMVNQDVGHVIEAGPGRVLTGLGKRIQRSLSGVCVFDPATLDKALEAVS